MNVNQKEIAQDEIIKEDAFLPVGKKHKEEDVLRDRGLWYNLMISFKENRLAMFCLFFLIIIIIASALAPLSPHDPDKMDLLNKLAPASKEHFLELTVWEGTISLELYMVAEYP